MRRILTILFVFFVCLFVGVDAFAVSEKAKKHYETAKSLYVAGDVEGAIAELEKALAIEPEYEAAKKLYEKLGGGKKKRDTQAQVTEEAPKAMSQEAFVAFQPAGTLDRDKMKESIRLVISNLIGQARADIFLMVSEVIKETFSETLRGESYSAMKDEMKSIVKDIVRDIVEREINEAFSSLREFSTNSYTNEFKIKQKGRESFRYERGNEPSQGDLNKKKAKELYSKAMELLDEEDYSGARKLLEDASKLDPENQEILRSLQRLSTLR
ncbi:MAG: hypothetical protein ABDH28_05620 [Brevinematia bacterium]